MIRIKQFKFVTNKFETKNITSFFFTGWADTPAVRSSMPDFYNKMKDKLRTVEQGSDTIVWLALAKSAVDDPKNKGGQFFQVGL